MIKKISSSLVFFTKLNLKSPLFIAASILGIFYLGVLVYYYSSSTIANPGNMLQLSSYLIQGCMFIFMYLGYVSVRLEYTSFIKDVLFTIPGSIKIKCISNFIFISLVNTLFCTFSCLVIVSTYKLLGFPFSSFYINSMYFIALYWFLPFLISSSIGALIGFWCKGKISFSILFVIWLVISPMNVNYLSSIFSIFGFKTFPDFLRLGILDPNMPYNAFSGFEITREQLFKIITWLTLLITLFFLTWTIRIRSRINKLIFSLLTIVFLVANFTIYFSKNVAPVNPHERYFNELNYYEKKENNIISTELNNYKINSYNINLSINKEVKVKVIVNFEVLEPMKDINFILYHKFIVEDVTDSSGQKLNFTQKSDQLTVSLKHQTDSLTFTYKGESSPYMPTNDKTVFLPFYFPWIPMKAEHQPIKFVYQSNHRLPLQPQKKIDYKVSYNGPLNLITNLNKKDPFHYQGESDNGISLISGELKEVKIGDSSIVLPITWERSLVHLNQYLDNLKKAFAEIKNTFSLEELKMPNKIYLVPAVGANDTIPSEYMWYSNDSLIILVDTYENHDENKFLEKIPYIPYELIGSITWKKTGLVYENYDISTLFNVLYADYLNAKLGVAEEQYFLDDFWVKEIEEKNKDSQIKKLIQNIASITQQENKKNIELFFKEWFLSLQNPKVSWNDIALLVEKYKGGSDK